MTVDDTVFTRFDDGSVLKVPLSWVNCFRQKEKDLGKSTDEHDAEFLHAVDEYWQRHEEPTKLSFDIPWKKEYGTKAELGQPVLYSYIRAYLFAWAFEMLAKKTGVKPVKVIVPDGGTEGGMREIRMPESAFQDPDTKPVCCGNPNVIRPRAEVCHDCAHKQECTADLGGDPDEVP